MLCVFWLLHQKNNNNVFGEGIPVYTCRFMVAKLVLGKKMLKLLLSLIWRQQTDILRPED